MMAQTGCRNWLDSIQWRVDFYQRSSGQRRKDPEFEWAEFERSPSGRMPALRLFAKRALHYLGLRPQPISREWLLQNAELLWETRSFFGDDLSKLLFDESLVLRLTSHRRFYYPRINFENLLDILAESPFLSEGLPADYLGIPLRVFEVRLRERLDTPTLKLVMTRVQLTLLNSYRQYLIRRNSIDLSPVLGDVVLDCGACIGEVSMLFAGLVGERGEVHLFDPVPLHTRFCRLQASLNPTLSHVLHANTLAVGDHTFSVSGAKVDSGEINPGGLTINSFSTTTLDDYASKNLKRVDFIKMDIEGAEMSALEGAASLIQEYKPRLAISAYHKPDDLWVIANKIKTLNSDYELSFGHHSPVQWESVIYATQR